MDKYLRSWKWLQYLKASNVYKHPSMVQKPHTKYWKPATTCIKYIYTCKYINVFIFMGTPNSEVFHKRINRQKPEYRHRCCNYLIETRQQSVRFDSLQGRDMYVVWIEIQVYASAYWCCVISIFIQYSIQAFIHLHPLRLHPLKVVTFYVCVCFSNSI